MNVNRLIFSGLFLCLPLWADLQIRSVETDKAVYRPNEKVSLTAEVFNTTENAEHGTMKLECLSGIDCREMLLKKEVLLKPGRNILRFETTVNGEYGKEFCLSLEQNGKKNVRNVLCEVYPGIIKFPRIHVLCVDAGYYVNYPDEAIRKQAEQYKKSGCNILKFFEWMPVWSEIVPEKDWWFHARWKNDISKRRLQEIEKFKVSRQKLRCWNQILRQKGILMVGYDNLTVAREAVWGKNGRLCDRKTGKPMRLWFCWDDLYSPNCAAYAADYGKMMRKSVEMIGWDGFFHDSFVGWSRRTANGVLDDGKPATDLNYDGVQSKILTEIEKNLSDIAPSFVQILNGLPWEVMSLQREVEGRTLQLTDRKTLKETLLKNRALFDPQTARHPNVIWMSEVVTGQPANRYYHTFGLIHQSVRQFTGQVVSNSALSYRQWDRPEDFVPALATYYANGLGTYAGFRLSRKCQEYYRKYTDFAIRYSRYLFDPELKWVDEKALRASRTDFDFTDTTFLRKSGEKHTLCMNLLNYPANRDIFSGNHEKPEVKKTFDVAYIPSFPYKAVRCFLMSPDQQKTMLPQELLVRREGNVLQITVPSLEYWNLIVWKFEN